MNLLTQIRSLFEPAITALVSDKADGAINPFMVLNELESGLRSHSLINSDEQRKRYAEMLSIVKQEYEDIVRTRSSVRSAPTKT